MSERCKSLGNLHWDGKTHEADGSRRMYPNRCVLPVGHGGGHRNSHRLDASRWRIGIADALTPEDWTTEEPRRLTPTERQELWTFQGGACAICGDRCKAGPELKGKHADHSHATGLLRGLICGWTNTFAGTGIMDIPGLVPYLHDPPAQRLWPGRRLPDKTAKASGPKTVTYKPRAGGRGAGKRFVGLKVVALCFECGSGNVHIRVEEERT